MSALKTWKGKGRDSRPSRRRKKTKMNPHSANKVAITLGAAGTILIIAGIFTPLGMSYGLFGGIACYIIAGTVKKMAGIEK